MAETAIVGGRLIDGTGADPVDDSLVHVQDGVIHYAGPKAGGKGAHIVEAYLETLGLILRDFREMQALKPLG